MVTTVTLIMWVFLADGSQTHTTEDVSSLRGCFMAAEKYMKKEHEMEPDGATFAAGCIVHNQRVV